MSRSVMMSDLSWPEYKRRLEEEDAIILLPVGAVEQHGYHLPLGTDWIMATEMSRRAAERVGGGVAPPVMYAYKSQIRSGGGNYPGNPDWVPPSGCLSPAHGSSDDRRDLLQSLEQVPRNHQPPPDMVSFDLLAIELERAGRTGPNPPS